MSIKTWILKRSPTGYPILPAWKEVNPTMTVVPLVSIPICTSLPIDITTNAKIERHPFPQPDFLLNIAMDGVAGQGFMACINGAKWRIILILVDTDRAADKALGSLQLFGRLVPGNTIKDAGITYVPSEPK